MIPPPELVEIEAHRALHTVTSGEYVGWEIAGALCEVLRPLPELTMVNRVTGLGLARPATREDVATIVAFFAGEGVRFGVGLHPDAQPRELPLWLEEQGLERGYAWMKFQRGVEPPPVVETDLHVEEVDPGRAGAFSLVVREGYEMAEEAEGWVSSAVGAPGWHCYVAFDGDEPAAAGALFVGGEVGWLGLAATRPAFRRRGGQGAIMAARIRRAAELGATTLVTETGERLAGRPSNSYRNILRFGFEEAYLRPNYVSRA